jgi:hypothetical protein
MDMLERGRDRATGQGRGGGVYPMNLLNAEEMPQL